MANCRQCGAELTCQNCGNKDITNLRRHDAQGTYVSPGSAYTDDETMINTGLLRLEPNIWRTVEETRLFFTKNKEFVSGHRVQAALSRLVGRGIMKARRRWGERALEYQFVENN